MTQQHCLRAVPFALVVIEQPAKLRLDSEQREEVLRDWHAAETLWFSQAGELVVAHAIEREVGGEVGERPIAFAQVEKMPHLRGLARETAGVVIGNPHQAIGIVEGQGTKKQSVHNAKDSGACPDAESDDENGEGREAGVATQGSEGVANVLEKGVKRRAATVRMHAL